jgi:hypothetical protein
MRRVAVVFGVTLACLLWAASAVAVTVDPAAKDFGGVTVGTTSGTASFTLTPSATGTVDTSPLQGGMGTTFMADDFTIHNVDCPEPSFPGGGAQSSCQFTVTLTPTGIGPRSYQMTFGDTVAPTTATVDLAGTGVSAPMPAPGTSTPKPKSKKCKKKHRSAAVAKKCKKKR